MRIHRAGHLVAGLLFSIPAIAEDKTGGEVMITPIEHASMVIQSGALAIYVDPVGEVARYAALPRPDIILITHNHHDHLAPAVVAGLKAADTAVIGPQAVVDQLGYGHALANGAKTTVRGVTIEAVPAYNTSAERLRFHPKGRDNGYVLEVGKKRIYVSGDTEDVEEMRKLPDIDHAFVSVNLPYTMSVKQAAAAILEMKPGTVTPYHYRGTEGMSDLAELQRLVGKDPEIEVRLMDWYGKEPVSETE